MSGDRGKGTAKRDAKGRFLPGHKPPRSPGRPPGANGVKARAARIAGDKLEAMLGKAGDVIEQALDDGDTHVATWLFDRVRPTKQADYISVEDVTDLKTPEDVVEAARTALMAAGNGDISLSEARAYIDLLARYGGMQGYVELEALKAKLVDVSERQARKPGTMDLSRVPEELRPAWGRGLEQKSGGR